MCADVATAGGEDFCAAHVLDIETMEQCAEYYGHLQPAEFGKRLVNLATQYHNALLVIENNSIGLAAIQPAIDLE